MANRKDLKLFAPEAVQINKTRGRRPGTKTKLKTKLDKYLEQLEKLRRKHPRSQGKLKNKLTKLFGKFEESPSAQKIFGLFIEPFINSMKEHGYEDGKRMTEWLFQMEERRLHTFIVKEEFKMPGIVLGIQSINVNRAAKNGNVLIVAELDEPTRHVFNVELIHENYDLHFPVVFQLSKAEFASKVLPRVVKG